MDIRVPLALSAVPFALAAQAPVSAVPTSYEQRYAEVMALAPRADRVASVNTLTITRDVARFTLTSGTLSLLSTVGGRTVGAVFVGHGTFEFTPPNGTERDRLVRFEGVTSLEAPITAAVFLFADSTAAELERKLHFAQGDVPDEARSLASKSLDYLGDRDSQSFDPDLMSAFLNNESNDLFYAHVKREDGGPLMFFVNPFEFEGVTLANRAPRLAWTHVPETICRFARLGAAPGAGRDRLNAPVVRDYRLDVTMTETASGNLSFASAARMEVTAATPAGPWIPFLLFEKLKVDSARWEGGGAATVFRGKDSPWLWTRFDQPLQSGDVRTLTLYYHGDLIERYGDFFFIRSTISWYPVSLAARNHATFEISYHTPSQFLLASVGDRLDSTVMRNVLTTRWVTPAPIRNASFNLGAFEEYKVKEEGVPPVSVMVSAEGHRHLAQAFLSAGSAVVEQRHMKETVGQDVTQSLKFFQHVYGEPSLKHFYATETPGGEGLAFPGLVDLSWITFQETDELGEQQVFRAHEVAHQWWGIGVDFASYHDQWLSEGFANFSGLWYLQTAMKANDKYFAMLHRWRDDIVLHRDEPSPIWLGYRVATSKDETGYQVLIYEKGAWVLQMLRILMLDLQSLNEDRFTGMMQDFYRSFAGGNASTEDFEQKVEEYAGIKMDWFFKDWVYGTGIPTYRVAYKTTAADNGRYRMTLRVEQEKVPNDFVMYVPVTVDLGEHREARVRVRVSGALSQIDLPLLPSAPKGLTFNSLDGVLCDVKMVGW